MGRKFDNFTKSLPAGSSTERNRNSAAIHYPVHFFDSDRREDGLHTLVNAIDTWAK